MGRRVNNIVRINLVGGLIGAVISNPRGAIERRIDEYNADGWSVVQLERAGDTNLLILILKFLLLVITLGLFTFGTGYYLIFEKDV